MKTAFVAVKYLVVSQTVVLVVGRDLHRWFLLLVYIQRAFKPTRRHTCV